MKMKRFCLLIGAAALLAACADEDVIPLVDAGADTGTSDTSTDATTDVGTTDTDPGDVRTDTNLDAADTADVDPLPDVSGDSGGEIGWTEFYNTYLEPAGCSGDYCHGGFSGGLSFTDADSAYDALVGQPVSESICGTTSRVVAGDASASSLYLRLRPSAMDEMGCEPPKMPPGSDGLSDEAAAILGAWIDAGALPN